MVRPHVVEEYVRPLYLRDEVLARKKIINTPPYIALPSRPKWAPPGIVPISLRKKPESIDKPSLDNLVNPFALLLGEPLLALILLEIR